MASSNLEHVENTVPRVVNILKQKVKGKGREINLLHSYTMIYSKMINIKSL